VLRERRRIYAYEINGWKKARASKLDCDAFNRENTRGNPEVILEFGGQPTNRPQVIEHRLNRPVARRRYSSAVACDPP
jgi:hypothetical protein